MDPNMTIERAMALGAYLQVDVNKMTRHERWLRKAGSRFIVYDKKGINPSKIIHDGVNLAHALDAFMEGT